MRRGFAALLALALCLALAACAKNGAAQGEGAPDASNAPTASDTAQTAAPADAAKAREPVRVSDTLHVEFVALEHDVDELLALQADFPWALADALERQNVTYDAISVTFGTSDEATVEAVQSGAVDIGFVTAETAVAEYPDGIAAIEQGDAPDLASGVIVLSDSWRAAAWEPAEALYAALGDLAPALARYTGEERGGVYVPLTDAVFERLLAQYEAENAEP